MESLTNIDEQDPVCDQAYWGKLPSGEVDWLCKTTGRGCPLEGFLYGISGPIYECEQYPNIPATIGARVDITADEIKGALGLR